MGFHLAAEDRQTYCILVPELDDESVDVDRPHL